MNPSKKKGIERELPHTHIYLVVLPLVFFIIWFLDSSIFNFSTILNNYIPLILRVVLFGLLTIIALIIIYISHQTLFHSHEPPDHLIMTGIFQYIRNPMYSGILLLYIAMVCLSISLLGILVLILSYLVFNKMVNFEENILESDFGEEYLNYKQSVPKWIPNPFKKLNLK